MCDDEHTLSYKQPSPLVDEQNPYFIRMDHKPQRNTKIRKSVPNLSHFMIKRKSATIDIDTNTLITPPKNTDDDITPYNPQKLKHL